jgi:hypothetical protein
MLSGRFVDLSNAALRSRLAIYRSGSTPSPMCASMAKRNSDPSICWRKSVRVWDHSTRTPYDIALTSTSIASSQFRVTRHVLSETRDLARPSGATPGQSGCRAPLDVLESFDRAKPLGDRHNRPPHTASAARTQPAARRPGFWWLFTPSNALAFWRSISGQCGLLLPSVFGASPAGALRGEKVAAASSNDTPRVSASRAATLDARDARLCSIGSVAHWRPSLALWRG